jgi:hypothetical protein
MMIRGDDDAPRALLLLVVHEDESVWVIYSVDSRKLARAGPLVWPRRPIGASAGHN